MNKKLTKNAVMLYLMALAKVILPLVLLPYLTRVLSKDVYGTVNYVKATMQYMQLFVDFGFMLSATKDIALARNNKSKLSELLGEVTLARIILCVCGFFIILIMVYTLPILRKNIIFTILSYIPIVLSIFFVDFLFRGLEEMHIVTIRFIVTRGIATIVTLFVVQSDNDLIWIPILEIIGNLVGIILVFQEILKRKLNFKISKIKYGILKLKESAVYFFSNMATTAFHVFNTVLVGYYLSESLVADWSICLQVAMGIQAFYTPITDAIYPNMVKNKNLKLVKKIIVIFMPIVFIGSSILYLFSPYILEIIGGIKYANNTTLLQAFIPLIIISFPAMLFGWPCLGAINKQKENSLTTIVTAILQCVGLYMLILFDKFTLINIAFLRGITEFFMFAMRFYLTIKYIKRFNK